MQEFLAARRLRDSKKERNASKRILQIELQMAEEWCKHEAEERADLEEREAELIAEAEEYDNRLFGSDFIDDNRDDDGFSEYEGHNGLDDVWDDY